LHKEHGGSSLQLLSPHSFYSQQIRTKHVIEHFGKKRYEKIIFSKKKYIIFAKSLGNIIHL